MKEKIVDKFCRDCYTTTPHKVIEVTDPESGRMSEKTICIKCLEARAYKKAKPKRKVMREDFMEV